MTPNKSYFLDKWFAIADNIQLQQTEIFKRNNIPFLSLELLPETDKNEWYRLYKIQNRIADNITKIINN